MEIPNTHKYEQMVTVPLKTSGQEEECIDILISELPPVNDVITLLRNECANADLWHRVALLYHRSGDSKSFLKIADEGFSEKLADHNSDSIESSVVPLLLSLGAYFYKMAAANVTDSYRVGKYLHETEKYYNKALSLGVKGFEAEYHVGRAYAYLLSGEHDNADKHLSIILSSLNPDFIPAIVGKALLAFANKDYKIALNFFRQALRLDPNSAANVRVGIGHCFWKLNNRDKAKLAYERAVELYPNDHNAVCALATYNLSIMKPEEVKTGVKLLARAHSLCPSHPPTQLYLADHYYYKKDFETSLQMSLDVCKDASDDIRKRSAYLAGRCYQAKGDFKYSMHYYYQALSDLDVGFMLPYFGLAQSYLHYNDIAHSAEALTKLLVHQPKNHLAMKMLGFLECTSEDDLKKEKAQIYLKSVLEHDSEDIWARLALATALECVDDVQAKQNYMQSLNAMRKHNLDVDPEIHNNLGCTLFRLGEYTEALQQFEMALESHDIFVESGKKPRPLMTTLNFNRARTKEALHEYRIAETIYKEILKKHPSYFSCFVRLAVMYRDRNNLHEADTYFKEALQSCLENPDVWANIGNLHLLGGETLLAQKKFLRILKMNDSLKRDAYSLIALGNVEVNKLLSSIYDTNTPFESQLKSMRDHMKKAVEYYQAVIKHEPNNLWAANGIGCVLAAKGLFTDAREVFSQVRESAHDFRDVWVNIGNTYMEQEFYFNAIQMYEGCKRFSVNTDVMLLQFLAKAYFYYKQFHKAKITLLKCLRVAPYDNTIVFCLAKTLRKIGWKPFQAQSGCAELTPTLDGLKHLNQAKKLFETLSKTQSNSSSLMSAAMAEAQHCDDLIRQTPHMISRIRAEYQKEQRLKDRREKEVEDFKRKQREEKVRQDLQKKQDEKEAIIQREAMKERIKKVSESLKLESESAKVPKRREKKERKKQSVYHDSPVEDEDEENLADVCEDLPPVLSIGSPEDAPPVLSPEPPDDLPPVLSPIRELTEEDYNDEDTPMPVLHRYFSDDED